MAVAVLLPLSFYFIVSILSKGKIKLPKHYIVERVDSQQVGGTMKYDTTYHKMGDLELTNQMGEKVSLNKNLKGKMLVINFFFVDCPSICPKLSANMALLQNGFRRDTKKEESLDTAVQFISITVMPERDSFPRLRAYADRFKANHDHWWFLTGDKKTIYNFASNELGISTGPGDGGADDFIHSDRFILVDTGRYIRGYYNGLDEIEVKKVADDLVLITLEKIRKKK